jgi:5-carboxymethyl-2-hydroxymuconate isomerase
MLGFRCHELPGPVMPHLVIDYFAAPDTGFNPTKAMESVYAIAAGSGVMDPDDIKVRLRPNAAILFGDGRQSFVHIEVSLLAGRSPADRYALSDRLVLGLRMAFPDIAAISADIREMEPESYRKNLKS